MAIAVISARTSLISDAASARRPTIVPVSSALVTAAAAVSVALVALSATSRIAALISSAAAAAASTLARMSPAAPEATSACAAVSSEVPTSSARTGSTSEVASRIAVVPGAQRVEQLHEGRRDPQELTPGSELLLSPVPITRDRQLEHRPAPRWNDACSSLICSNSAVPPSCAARIAVQPLPQRALVVASNDLRHEVATAALDRGVEAVLPHPMGRDDVRHEGVIQAMRWSSS